jgi:hypothetical protein
MARGGGSQHGEAGGEDADRDGARHGGTRGEESDRGRARRGGAWGEQARPWAGATGAAAQGLGQ